MRIISGKARSIQLKVPRGEVVRPTADRVKESLFAMLGPLAGFRVLDLFAGSGALGLEALSRGAADVVFVERSGRHLAVLQENLAAVLHAMGTDVTRSGPARTVAADVRTVPAVLAELAGAFDLILADPPYVPAPGEFGAVALLGSAEFAAWAGSRPLLVLEHEAGTELPWAPLSAWQLLKQREFGRTVISFSRVAGACPPPRTGAEAALSPAAARPGSLPTAG